MIIDLLPLLYGEKRELELEGSFDISDLSSDIVDGIAEFHGKCVDRVGFIELTLALDVRANVVCSRCASEFSYRESFKVELALVQELENEDTDEFVLLTEGKFNLEDSLKEFIILNLPSIFLCREDCRGVCAGCGANLNEGECGCKGGEVDPRLLKLLDYLKQ